MEDIFRSYWWLLFPLGWFIASGWQSWLNYRARKDALRLIEAYAAKGQEPPAELVKSLTQRIDFDCDAEGGSRKSTTNWGWYQVALFGALAAGFAYMAHGNILQDEGLSDALFVASIVLGALSLASLVGALTWKGPRA